MFEPWDRHENMIPVQGPFGFRPLLANSSRSGCCHIDNHIESNQSMNLPSIYLCECSYLNLLTYRWIHILVSFFAFCKNRKKPGNKHAYWDFQLEPVLWQARTKDLDCGEKATSWKAQATEWSEKLGVPVSVDMWTGRDKFEGVGLPKTARVQTLLNLTAVEKMQQARAQSAAQGQQCSIDDVLEDCFIDVSQNPSRKKFSTRVVPCLCTSTRLYSFARDRCLFPLEYLRLQGWGLDVQTSACSPQKVKEMAGLGMSLPCLGAIIWAVFLCKGLPNSSEV